MATFASILIVFIWIMIGFVHTAKNEKPSLVILWCAILIITMEHLANILS